VQPGEAMQLLYRDIAGALRKAGAGDEAVVLSDPNASVGVGYYGRLRTVGTLYWENRDGLLAAAELIDATDDAEAAARMYARGITHVVMVSSYDFQAEYRHALHGDGDDREAKASGLGRRLLYEHKVPAWLRPLNYRVPAELARLGFKVAVFAVDFATPVAVAQERIGRYQLSKGANDQAEISFMTAMAADPSLPEPWLRLGELALAAGRAAEAYNFIRAGIARAPASERARLKMAAASLFERAGAYEQADALAGTPEK
jgi:tetratricopeptide (TPR) repeat protein